MQSDRKWNDKLNDLLNEALEECGSRYPLDLGLLVEKAIRGLHAPRRDALAKKQIRRELGSRLRRWPPPDELPLIPGLLDGYVRGDGGYVRTTKLSLEDWRAQRTRLARQADTLMTRVAAIDKLLEQLRADKERA